MATIDSTGSESLFTPRDCADEKSQRQTQPRMGVGRPFPPDLPELEAYVVDFEGQDDPWVPVNWASWRKYAQTLANCIGRY